MPPTPMPPHIQTMLYKHLKHHKEKAIERCKEKERKEKENEQQKKIS